jgi:hypothetical protein
MKRRCLCKIGAKCLCAEMAIVQYANVVAGPHRSKSGSSKKKKLVFYIPKL